MRAGTAKRRPSNSFLTRRSRCSVTPAAASASARIAKPRYLTNRARSFMAPFYSREQHQMVLEKPVFPLPKPRQILAQFGATYAAAAVVAFLFAASGPIAIVLAVGAR